MRLDPIGSWDMIKKYYPDMRTGKLLEAGGGHFYDANIYTIIESDEEHAQQLENNPNYKNESQEKYEEKGYHIYEKTSEEAL